jgi:hypothetical protein
MSSVFASEKQSEQRSLFFQEFSLLFHQHRQLRVQVFKQLNQISIPGEQPSFFGLLSSAETIGDQRWAIETKAAQGERADGCERVKCSVIKLKKMLRRRFMTRILQRRLLRTRWPVIQFVLVAAKATVEQVVQAVITPFRLWLKMVDGQLTAGVRFRDAAKFTGEAGPLSDVLSDVSRQGHAGCRVDELASCWRRVVISRRKASFSAATCWMRFVTVINWVNAASTWACNVIAGFSSVTKPNV